MISQGPIRQGVKFASIGVGLDLLVPEIGVKLREPFGELCHVAGAEAGDVLFNFSSLVMMGR